MLRYILIFLFFNSLCYDGKAELAIFDKFVKYLLIERNVQTQLFGFDVENGLDVLRGIHEDIVDEKQSYRLTEFLFEKYGEEFVVGQKALMTNPRTEEEKINHLNMISYGDKNYVYRWDSHKTRDEERAFLMDGFVSNPYGFDKLKECLQIKIFGDEEENEENNINFEDFYKIYKRFHPKQLFFEDIPIFNEGFYYNHQNKDEEICPICLEKFKINDYVYKCSKCKVYHVKCIARWSDGFPTNDTNEPPSCPACREKIIITPKLTVKQKHNGKGSSKGKHPKHCMSVFK
uniref:RING-type domain-containing protein n=1 Tax=Meloidogyne javanica TaxID=6303 RepID=A0A915MV13_MELJA